jgi:hypothetical protein
MQDRLRARLACYIARQAGNRDRVLTMKTMLRVTVLILGALGSLSSFAQSQMAYGDAMDTYKTLLTQQVCPKMLQGFNQAKQQHPDQAFVLESGYHAICECQIARVQVVQSRLSPAERQEVVDAASFQERMKASVMGKCMGEMARTIWSEPSCAQNYNKDLRKGANYCHCLSAKIGSLSDADAMELGLASADYLPRLAEAKKKGLPPPAAPASMKQFLDADKACSAH